MAKKDYKNKASDRVNTFVNDNKLENINEINTTDEFNTSGKKVNIMLRLDSSLGTQVKAKAKRMGLPSTKYIETLIRRDLKHNYIGE